MRYVERRMPSRHPGAAGVDLRVPGAPSVVNPRLPRRATRHGRRGATDACRHSPLAAIAVVELDGPYVCSHARTRGCVSTSGFTTNSGLRPFSASTMLVSPVEAML